MLRAEQTWRWRAGIVTLAAVGMLGVAVSCAGLQGEAVGLAAGQGAETQPEQPAALDGHSAAPVADFAAPGGLPFPEPRETSALTEHLLLGRDAEQLGLGALRQGSALALSGGDGAAYGVWRFNPGGTPPDSVAVLLEAGQTTQAWIGLADFSAGRWELHGPYSQTKTLSLDEARFRAPSGDVFVAVLVAPGESALVNALSVRVHSGPNQPPIAQLEATPNTGYAPLLVQLGASDSFDQDGSIVEYAWDFHNDGLYDGFSDEPFISFQYNSPGVYSAKVRVTDDQFAHNTATVAINVDVQPQGWVTVTLAEQYSGSEWACLAEVDNKPAISYYGGDGDPRIIYAYSSSATGTDALDWTHETVESFYAGSHNSLAVINGKPAISYRKNTQPFNSKLHYAYSSEVDGSSGWQTVVVDANGITGYSTSLALVDGKPAISYRSHFSDGGQLKFAYSSMPDGSGGWETITVDPAVTGEGTSLAFVDGRPGISYRNSDTDSLNYATSTVADGSSGWSTEIVNPFSNVGYYSSLEVVNGKPAISYWASGYVSYSFNALAEGGDYWVHKYLARASSSLHTSLAVINGKPAIVSLMASDLYYFSSGASDGSADWSMASADTGGLTSPISLAEIDGRAAVIYYEDFPGFTYRRNLKYAVLYE